MTKAGKAGEFLPFERMFICQLKLAGDKFPTIWEKFMKRFGKISVEKQSMIIFYLGQKQGDHKLIFVP